MPSYLFSKDALLDTPTTRAGVSAEVEKNNRIFACEMINQAGVMLRLPQVTISTSQIILHRFYYRKSMKEYPVMRVAMTSLLLATKVEETARKIKDILNVFDRLLKKLHGQPLDPLDSHSKRYARWRGQLNSMELVVLKELGYILYVDHPHKFFFYYVDCLILNRHVAQRAWNFLNDSMRTNVCLRFRPEVVATGGIYLAVLLLQKKLPDKWYELFDTSYEDMIEVASIISELYTRTKVKYIALDEQDAKTNELLVYLLSDNKPDTISEPSTTTSNADSSTKTDKDSHKSRSSKSKHSSSKKNKDKENEKKSNFSEPINGDTTSSSASSSSSSRRHKERKDSKKYKDKPSSKSSSKRRSRSGSRSRSFSGTRSHSGSRSRSRERKTSKKEKEEPKKETPTNKDLQKKKEKNASSTQEEKKSKSKSGLPSPFATPPEEIPEPPPPAPKISPFLPRSLRQKTTKTENLLIKKKS